MKRKIFWEAFRSPSSLRFCKERWLSSHIQQAVRQEASLANDCHCISKYARCDCCCIEAHSHYSFVAVLSMLMLIPGNFDTLLNYFRLAVHIYEYYDELTIHLVTSALRHGSSTSWQPRVCWFCGGRSRCCTGHSSCYDIALMYIDMWCDGLGCGLGCRCCSACWVLHLWSRSSIRCEMAPYCA